jgi:hypothetical protein
MTSSRRIHTVRSASKQLCRGWTEADIAQAVSSASDLQRSVLRSIAKHPGTNLHAIAKDVGAKNHLAVSGALSRWYQDTTRPLGIKDPTDGKDSRPMFVVKDHRTGLWRYTMTVGVAAIVLANARI